MRKVLYLMGILNDLDVQWMVSNGLKSVFPTGSVLVKQGVPVEYLYILLDGRLSVEVGKGVQIATLMSGEVIGEISFVDSRPPLASVVAQVPSIVLGIKTSVLKYKWESDSQFGSRFYRAVALFLADRLRSTTGRLGYQALNASDDEVGEDVDELDADFMQAVSMANVRFDMLIRSVK